MIDLVFLAHNRKAFTEQSFAALLANTNWGLVQRLFLLDDDSEDGTREFLEQALSTSGIAEVHLAYGPFRGPVAATNHYLAKPRGPEIFAKVDNDIICCPGWLDAMWQAMMDNPDLDVLGVAPTDTSPALSGARHLEPARHIGGVGIIRRRIFDICRPTPNGRYGWSEFQTAHPQFAKAWLRPALPLFGLDQLRSEPWASLTADYIERGWMRPWEHGELLPAYYEWWSPA